MSTRSPETPDSEPPPQPKTVVPHVLCHCCSRIVKKSKIIQALAADRLEERLEEHLVQRSNDSDSETSKYEAHEAEFFFHNRSRSYLWESSAAGCHLCSLGLSESFDQGRPSRYTFHSVVSVKYDKSVYTDDKILVRLNFGRYRCIDVAEELLNDSDHMDSRIECLMFEERELSVKDRKFVPLELLELKRFPSEEARYQLVSGQNCTPRLTATGLSGPLPVSSTKPINHRFKHPFGFLSLKSKSTCRALRKLFISNRTTTPKYCPTAETFDHDATLASGPVFSMVSTSTDSPRSMSIVRSWMDHCLRNHPNCNRKLFDTNGTENKRLPTRLVDVGESDGELAPRLILTSASETPSIEYLTLSHSWAITSTASSLKLTSGNLQRLQKQIPVRGLPRTFQEAMELTRRLGYRYIWIDSLCIMQDSNSDWHREALTMSSVYGNSSCSIAALGVDGADTCYAQRNPLQVFPCNIAPQKEGNSVYAILMNDTSIDVPLLTRGWVMQERLLSPRVIYTGVEQLFWECCSRTASEGLPSLKGEEDLRYGYHIGWAAHLENLEYCTKRDFDVLCGQEPYEPESDKVPEGLPYGREDPKVVFSRAWSKIVKNYDRTEFTCESDRLIALAGVAKAIEHSKGFTYVAGTWKELWPMDLLWYSSGLDAGSEDVSSSDEYCMYDGNIPDSDNESDDEVKMNQAPRKKTDSSTFRSSSRDSFSDGFSDSSSSEDEAKKTKAGSNSNELTDLSRSKAPSWSWAAAKRDKYFLLVDDFAYMTDKYMTGKLEVTYLAHTIEFTCPTSTARYTGTRGDEERITLTLRSGVKRGEVIHDKRIVSVKQFGVPLTDIFSSSFLQVDWDDWDHTPGRGDSVVVLSMIRAIGRDGDRCHAGLVLMPEEGAQNKDGQPCYRRVGMFRNDYSGDENNWEEETVCLC